MQLSIFPFVFRVRAMKRIKKKLAKIMFRNCYQIVYISPIIYRCAAQRRHYFTSNVRFPCSPKPKRIYREDWASLRTAAQGTRHNSIEWAIKRQNIDPLFRDPDGWDRQHLKRSLLQAISENEYVRRGNASTVDYEDPHPNAKWMRDVVRRK